MQKNSRAGQTSIEYLLLLGGIVTVVLGVGILIINSISSPQPQVHCSFSAFSNQTPLAYNDVSIDTPNSCAPTNLAKNTTLPIISFYVGPAQCDASDNPLPEKYVGKVALFALDPNDKIVCSNDEAIGLIDSTYSASLTVDSTTQYASVSIITPQACNNPSKMSYFLKLKDLTQCSFANPGVYSLQMRGITSSGGEPHTDVEPGAIIVK